MTAIESQPKDGLKAYAIFPNNRRMNWLSGSRCYWNGHYYETPVPRTELARSLDVMPHHDSAMEAKINVLMSTIEPTDEKILSADAIERMAWDYLIYGDYFAHANTNRLGGLSHYEHLPSLHTRRAKKTFVGLDNGSIDTKYKAENVLHSIRYDGRQDMYGRPGYMAALLSIFLGQASTKFRYHYVKNRSNTGFLMYLSGQVDDKVIDEIEDALAGGDDDQFGNVVIHDAAGGSGANTSEKIKLIPISDSKNKDDYPEVQQVALETVLAAHRWPPQLMGIVPKNAAGFGSVAEAAQVAFVNEILPLHRKLNAINQHAGRELIKFNRYDLGLPDKTKKKD